MTSLARVGSIRNRLLAELIDVAAGGICRAANLWFVASDIVHLCHGGQGKRTVEFDEREIIRGRRIRDFSRDPIE